MITSDTQLAEAQANAEHLSTVDWNLALRYYTSTEDRTARGFEREVVRRKLARLEADIADYLSSSP